MGRDTRSTVQQFGSQLVSRVEIHRTYQVQPTTYHDDSSSLVTTTPPGRKRESRQLPPRRCWTAPRRVSHHRCHSHPPLVTHHQSSMPHNASMHEPQLGPRPLIPAPACKRHKPAHKPHHLTVSDLRRPTDIQSIQSKPYCFKETETPHPTRPSLSHNTTHAFSRRLAQSWGKRARRSHLF